MRLTISVATTPKTKPKTAASMNPPVSAERINAPYSDCVVETAEPEKVLIMARSATKVRHAVVTKIFVVLLSRFCLMILARRLISFRASSLVYFIFLLEGLDFLGLLITQFSFFTQCFVVNKKSM